MKNGGIFINYRRCDRSGNPRDHALFVDMLTQELADHFGADNVFIDASTNMIGGRLDEPRNKLTRCDVFLAVIHPEWLDDLRKQRESLADGELDPVHYEISTTLNGIRRSRDRTTHHPEVIPILLEKADPPKSGELPEDIRELALLQAFRLRFGSLSADLTRLRTELEMHTVSCWPPPPTTVAREPRTQNNSLGISGRTAPGQLASLVPAAATFSVAFSGFAPDEKWEWASTTYLLIWSATTILMTLLGVLATTIFGRSFHRMEHHIQSLSEIWFLTARLAIVAMALILLLPLTGEFGGVFLLFVIGIPLNVILAYYIIAAAIRGLREDSRWPPQFSLRPMALRRTIVRLEQQLTSLWHPSLTRIQREQAWTIIHQLDNAVAILREAADLVWTRRSWLRADRPKLAAGYGVWLAATLGLSIASMYESAARDDALGWYLSIPIGVVACGLGIGSVELIYRNDRKARHWFIEEIEKDREDRLLRHLPAQGSDGYER